MSADAPDPMPSTAVRPARRRMPRWPRTLVGKLALTATAAGTALLVPSGYVAAASAGRIVPIADVTAAPVALVLGAGLTPSGAPSAALAARLDIAVNLYQRNLVKVILVSGDNRTMDHNEPDAMRAYLLTAGIPASKIVADYAGRDTYDSCYRARTIFGVTKLVVVSQDFHVPRAVATCRALGVDATAVGDSSFERVDRRRWALGWIRELPAADKMTVDLLSSRKPVLGAREPGVDVALADGS